MAPEQQKKPIDFGGNPDHVTLWVRVRVRVTDCVTPRHITRPRDGRVIPSNTAYVLQSVCLTVIIEDCWALAYVCMRSTECPSTYYYCCCCRRRCC